MALYLWPVVISRDAREWPYEQAAAILREQIRAGELGPRLPSQMRLAEQLGVSPMTVQRALKVLKDEGRIESRPGLGTFVVP